MTIYYVLFASAFALSVLQYSNVHMRIPDLFKIGRTKIINHSAIYLFLIFLFIAAIVGLRAPSVGIDTKGYIKDFYTINNLGISQREIKTEIVNASIMWLCGRISNDPQFYMVIYAIIVSALFSRFIKNNSENPFLSTVIFIGMFFAPEMNLMRQWLAISIGVTAYDYYQKEENKKAIIALLIAGLCHTTALVLFVIPLVEKVKKKKNIVLPVVILSLIMVVFRVQLFSLAAFFIPKYNDYFTKYYFMNEGAFNIKNLIFAIILLGVAYVLAFKRELIKTEEQLNSLYVYEILMILALAFSLCGTTYYMFHRVVYYFSVFLVIIIPSITTNLKFKKIINLLVTVAMLIMLMRNGVSDNNGISEYMWFWQ